MPPPNITGLVVCYMGHALDNTMQDILIRWKRMQGYEALWQPGTDHAAIATEVMSSTWRSRTRRTRSAAKSSSTAGL